jgi:Tfp pilus assembly protein PilZ
VQEKRVHARVPVDISVTCELKDRPAIPGMAKDLSVGGMFVETTESLPFNTQLIIVVRIPGMDADSRIPGTVRWAKPNGIGVQFGMLGARETHALTELMRS